MCIHTHTHTYIHTYIYIYIYKDLSTGYWLRFSTEVYGSKREKTILHEYLQECCFVLAEISESLRKPPGVYRRI